MKPDIFYAWQSDLPSKTNRSFIRDAAESAVGQLYQNFSIGESPRLDSDTQGFSGMPEIAGIIFKKIETCGIFLADLSFVARTALEKGSQPKYLPNPNVLIELGFAAKSLGWNRIISVINVEYGKRDELPFDIKHRRWPICYRASSTQSDQAIAKSKEKLASKLYDAIEFVLNSEHAKVDEAISNLDQFTVWIINELPKDEWFPPQSWSGHPSQLRMAREALQWIRKLNIIANCYNKKSKQYGYRWTYFGRLVLEKLSQLDASDDTGNTES